MAFVLTKVRAFGIEAEEVVNKRYLQHLVLNITAANTDVDLDLGDHVAGSLGTFWAAVDATATGLTGLAAMQDIATRAEAYLSIGGTGLNDQVQADGTRPSIVKIDSDASAGGGATETMVVTGLLTTDTILGVSQFVDGAGAAVGILAWGGATGVCSVASQLSTTWNADPGAGAKIRVAVSRNVTAPEAGTYTVTMGTLAPNLLFLSGSAPTAYTIVLTWLLKDKEEPVSVYAAA